MELAAVIEVVEATPTALGVRSMYCALPAGPRGGVGYGDELTLLSIAADRPLQLPPTRG